MSEIEVCLVFFPLPTISVLNIFLEDLLCILNSQCKLNVLGSNFPRDLVKRYENVNFEDLQISMHFRHEIEPIWWSTLLQIFKIIFIQFKMAFYLLKNRNIDIMLFYVGGAYLFLPLLLSKILRKKVIFAAIGRSSKTYRRDNILSKILFKITSIMEEFIFYITDMIIVESSSTINFLGLEKYSHKIFCEATRFVDINNFKIKKNWTKRRCIVGYIGRLSEPKGIKNLVKAIKYLKDTNIKFLICGKGPLQDWIITELKNELKNGNIKFIEWIPHDEVPRILNELKLLVLPSYSEGLPTIVIEAMACGTPVLTTPVGGIPDLIIDKETGFIIKKNSPKTIAKDIVKVLEHPNLEKVIKNANKIIHKEFTYEKAIERWKTILCVDP